MVCRIILGISCIFLCCTTFNYATDVYRVVGNLYSLYEQLHELHRWTWWHNELEVLRSRLQKENVAQNEIDRVVEAIHTRMVDWVERGVDQYITQWFKDNVFSAALSRIVDNARALSNMGEEGFNRLFGHLEFIALLQIEEPWQVFAVADYYYTPASTIFNYIILGWKLPPQEQKAMQELRNAWDLQHVVSDLASITQQNPYKDFRSKIQNLINAYENYLRQQQEEAGKDPLSGLQRQKEEKQQELKQIENELQQKREKLEELQNRLAQPAQPQQPAAEPQVSQPEEVFPEAGEQPQSQLLKDLQQQKGKLQKAPQQQKKQELTPLQQLAGAQYVQQQANIQPQIDETERKIQKLETEKQNLESEIQNLGQQIQQKQEEMKQQGPQVSQELQEKQKEMDEARQKMQDVQNDKSVTVLWQQEKETVSLNISPQQAYYIVQIKTTNENFRDVYINMTRPGLKEEEFRNKLDELRDEKLQKVQPAQPTTPKPQPQQQPTQQPPQPQQQQQAPQVDPVVQDAITSLNVEATKSVIALLEDIRSAVSDKVGQDYVTSQNLVSLYNAYEAYKQRVTPGEDKASKLIKVIAKFLKHAKNITNNVENIVRILDNWSDLADGLKQVLNTVLQNQDKFPLLQELGNVVHIVKRVAKGEPLPRIFARFLYDIDKVETEEEKEKIREQAMQDTTLPDDED